MTIEDFHIDNAAIEQLHEGRRRGEWGKWLAPRGSYGFVASSKAVGRYIEAW